jgi:cytochrome P450
MHMARVATRDAEIRGTKIAAGQKVVLWYPSGNRDEDVFRDPYVFDVSRTPNDHIAFGIGEHFCLGAGLARLELRVIFEELLSRYSSVELARPVEWARSNRHTGIRHLVVEFRA